MIDLYYWPTPNGKKVSIMLEECELPYNTIKVNIGAGDQFKAAFLGISPNNRIPAKAPSSSPDCRPDSLPPDIAQHRDLDIWCRPK